MARDDLGQGQFGQGRFGQGQNGKDEVSVPTLGWYDAGLKAYLATLKSLIF
ncbi:Hypothetical protein FKW44_003726 [Caligus rogercresseyi]|uniref:Uncharacterized protein n=1 Tax=Caligus rogercresseyi TaxID=217165 RepID=A0A7T8QXB8_CALRO|nr:Hypothetical protein FKW44_003726 [Caligus rogercresseyi]